MFSMQLAFRLNKKPDIKDSGTAVMHSWKHKLTHYPIAGSQELRIAYLYQRSYNTGYWHASMFAPNSDEMQISECRITKDYQFNHINALSTC